MKHPVLVVDDEPKVAQLLVDYLRFASYEAHALMEGGEVIAWVKANSPQLILLDLMLPGKSGLEICRELRLFSDVPIIMITARVDDIDRLLGLEIGADDYICKPFNPREVIARVKTVLRRTNGHSPTLALYGITLDDVQFRATVHGQSLSVTPVEFRLLKTFIAEPKRVFSRSQLMDCAYNDNRVVNDRAVDSHIKNLRKKLASLLPPEQPAMIHSIYGVGYRWEP
ncbi:response regulator [Candidatus Methylospira mobilis]|nr:response regulator [Candidatus Methylospira mobilis]